MNTDQLIIVMLWTNKKWNRNKFYIIHHFGICEVLQDLYNISNMDQYD